MALRFKERKKSRSPSPRQRRGRDRQRNRSRSPLRDDQRSSAKTSRKTDERRKRERRKRSQSPQLAGPTEEVQKAAEEKIVDKPKPRPKPAPAAVPQQPMIIVHVNDRLGTKASVPCFASDPIKLFKAQVAAQIGRQPHEILLKRQSERPFNDALTLEDYGISNGVQLDLELDTGD
ncbi:MAG: hypothetical protein M1814_005272 [Vezdaea aestivalis]|nr:MAG: hypothetical protein M1814_005272 [Vezdaea aestivalis]